MSVLSKEQLRAILKENNVKTTEDINNVLKDMIGIFLQEALEAELDTELGYPRMPKGLKIRAIGAMGTPRNRYVQVKAKLSFPCPVTGQVISSPPS